DGAGILLGVDAASQATRDLAAKLEAAQGPAIELGMDARLDLQGEAGPLGQALGELRELLSLLARQLGAAGVEGHLRHVDVLAATEQRAERPEGRRDDPVDEAERSEERTSEL